MILVYFHLDHQKLRIIPALSHWHYGNIWTVFSLILIAVAFVVTPNRNNITFLQGGSCEELQPQISAYSYTGKLGFFIGVTNMVIFFRDFDRLFPL